MQLVWRPLALADRASIMDHISQDNPAAAIVLDESFESKAEYARHRPTLYKKGRVPGTREIVVLPNYIMVYRIKPGALEIVRILHARQRWP
jgi:addiction module RelE/StbE family toxin